MSFKDNFSANPVLAFDKFSKLPKTLEPTMTEVIKFVGHSVKSNDPTDTKRFGRPSIATQTEPTVVSMIVKKVVQFLFDALQAEEKKEKGVADFSKCSSEGNSSWEYRAVFAIPLAYLSNYFYGLVMTIKLEGDVEDEESWDLRGSTPRNFSATIDLMRLVVTAGFRDP
ncbi:delta-endotoxin CytB [Armillaria solidipes]|uniref:Delta-endotoxin CytB n=1 Tax=Armillaria solidipes TaxID=1076256 RepID=A0A2H3C5Y8_9AGAR|nr:delta-endotoxin CytB [Armillaria solidipes]